MYFDILQFLQTSHFTNMYQTFTNLFVPKEKRHMPKTLKNYHKSTLFLAIEHEISLKSQKVSLHLFRQSLVLRSLLCQNRLDTFVSYFKIK